MVSAKKLNDATSPPIAWRFRTTGNSSWGMGIVPESSVGDHDYLYKRGKVGFNSESTGGGEMTRKK